jgi:site-specific recombinase XerD
MGGRFGRSAAPKTISRKLAGLSSFFDYLVESKVMTYNPCSSVKRPKRVVVSPTEALRPEQVTELLQTARDNKNSGPLHYALLCTFFTTGLRKSEVLHLLMRDYEVHGEHRLLHYKGKGGKMGRKVLHPMCTEAIDEYIEWMNEKERTLQKEDWLFQPTRNPSNPGELNKPLNPKTINELLDRYAKKCGFAQKVTPHSARATFISTLLDQGIDIYTIAGEVDHSSVVTTQSYDKRDKKLEQSPTLKLKY